MKNLLVLRHAKSSWKGEGVADHDRPLNKRGKRDAPRVGELLQQRGLVPDLLISSTAKRARKTASKLAKACGYQGVIALRGELYLAPAQTYYETVQQLPDDAETALFVGHNPGISDWLTRLTGCQDDLPTAALAHIAVADSWSQVQPGQQFELLSLWFPREDET